MIQLLSRDHLASPPFAFHIQNFAFAPGEAVAQHTHEFVEVVYIRAGRGCHLEGHHAAAIGAGSLLVIPPGRAHGYHSEQAEPLRAVNVLFNADFFADELQVLQRLGPWVDLLYIEPWARASVPEIGPLVLNPIDRLASEDHLDRILTEMRTAQPGYAMVVKARLIEWFILLSRAYREYAEGVARPAEAVVIAARDYVAQHVDKAMTLEQMARSTAMSRSAFAAKFRAVTGTSFITFRNAKRIDLAQQLLRDTEMTVTEIAIAVGVGDLSTFYRQFHALVGISPQKYRRHARGRVNAP